MEDAAYKQFVELEESHFWFVGRRRIFMSLLDSQLGGRADANVLDVGCGAGGMLEPLARYGTVTGLDTSEELIEVCRRRGFRGVEVGSAYNLPVEDASVDLLTMFDTIEHIPDEGLALAECRRALAPAGLLFVSVPAYQFLYANNDRVAHHQRRYTSRRLRRAFNAAGLRPLKVTYFNTLLFPAILPAVLLKKLRERYSEPDDTTNLTHEIPTGINTALAAIMSSERHLLARANLPFGHSIIGMATRDGR